MRSSQHPAGTWWLNVGVVLGACALLLGACGGGGGGGSEDEGEAAPQDVLLGSAILSGAGGFGSPGVGSALVRPYLELGGVLPFTPPLTGDEAGRTYTVVVADSPEAQEIAIELTNGVDDSVGFRVETEPPGGVFGAGALESAWFDHLPAALPGPDFAGATLTRFDFIVTFLRVDRGEDNIWIEIEVAMLCYGVIDPP